ncbi:elongator complex protein 5-like [Lineus longissimus]|uniref:elongator complex protein 5-like n=1 Tax=Lineus longissimus TaxID=88925 RepID=UPI002B4E60CC
MMLTELVNSKEDFRILLVEDSIHLSGRGLLKAFIQQLASRVDEVHYIGYDIPPEAIIGRLEQCVQSRIVTHDLCSDAHGWNGGTLNLDTDLMALVSKRIGPGVETVAIVFDSLSPLLLHRTAQYTCQTINSLAYRNVKKGITVKHLVGLVHRDLHDSSILALLEHTATTILNVGQPEHSNFTGTCHVTQKKGSGKITKKKEYFSLDASCQLSHSQEASMVIAVEKLATESKEPDPAANLTFNLRLTSDEKEARSQVKLPYTHHEERKEQLLGNPQETGKIFYHPDKEDDFDEEDPDDDLDI